MKTNLKRWLAGCLCLMMLVGFIPSASAMAEAPEAWPLVDADEERPAVPVIDDDPVADVSSLPARSERPTAAEEPADLLADEPTTAVKVNLAKGKTATASTVYPDDRNLTADKAVDGDATGNSRWSSMRCPPVLTGSNYSDEQFDTETVQWLKVDLGQTYKLDEFKIVWEGACATSYKIQGSADDTAYTDLVANGAASQTNLTQTYTLDTPAENIRYVKVLCETARKNEWGYSIYELEVYSPDVTEEIPVDTDVNLALDRPVTATTEESSKGNVAANAVDGDNSTRWASNTDQFPQEFTVDLGQTCDLTKFVVNFFDGATSRYYSFKIEASEDGNTYTQIYDGTANKTVGKVSGEFPEGTKGRFVRLTTLGAKKTAGDAAYAINSGFYEFEVYGPQPPALPGPKDNLTQCEGVEVKAEASSVEKNYLGKPSGLTADKAIDGIAEKSADGKNGPSRWSPDKDTAQEDYNAWLKVDLGTPRTVQEIDFKFSSEAKAYSVQVSLDGNTWETVATVDNGVGENANFDIITRSFYLPEPTIVRYVRYEQTKQWLAGNGNYYGGGVYELEVYQEPLIPQSAKSVLEVIMEEPLTIENGKLVLPESPNDQYEVILYGSDNQQVIALDGNVRTPLVDMPVNILYKVVNKEDATDFAAGETDMKLTVPGQFQAEDGDNEKPNVVPGLREWKGGTGNFTLTDSSAIVLDAASAAQLTETAETIQMYFEEMLGRDITVKTGTASTGDIFLKLDAQLAFLGEEGYTLEAGEVLTIASSVPGGVLYGGISVTQVLYQDETHANFPQGTARDYPKYEIRSGMLDVGRMYIPLDYVKEMALYMGWFKLNNLHMHINDYWGNSGYAAFRLESTQYPSIVAKDGHYTKEEYKQFQKDLAKYGITVITEIDSPYHAECFREIPGLSFLGAGQMDILSEDKYNAAIKVIKDLMDEYLDGDDPVFQGGNFHIGTDEYLRNTTVQKEAARQWTNDLIEYAVSKGVKARAWGSIGSNGFAGDTPVSKNATMNLWATYWYPTKEMYADGYDVINTDGGWMYIVPRSNAGYVDRVNLPNAYNNFEVNKFTSSRNGDGTVMPLAHPQTKGAQFCVWNDMTSFRGGYSEFDVYDRFKDMVGLVAEKTWYGEKSEGQTGAQFVERFAGVRDRIGGANPGRVVESKTDLVTDVDFTEDVKDFSGNGYNVKLNGTAAIGEDAGKPVVTLDGAGSLSLPYGSIGYPYTAKIDVKLAADTPENTLIFSGADGELYANVDGTGHPGFKRGYHEGTQYVGYTFVWESVTLPTDQWFTLALTCDASHTTLYIDGVAQTRAVMTAASRNNGFQATPTISGTAPTDSTTFILPVERIGENLKGQLAGLMVYDRVLSANEIKALNGTNEPVDPDTAINVALNKEATSSSNETTSLTPDKAVDGEAGRTHNGTKYVPGPSRWSPVPKKTQEDCDAWLQVDLGVVYDVERLHLQLASEAKAYSIKVSVDGQTWETVVEVADGIGELADCVPIDKDFPLEASVKARYIRYEQTKQFKAGNGSYYGGGIYELEAYAKPIVRTVTFVTNGGNEIEPVEILGGTPVARPVRPKKDGFDFEGWYADEQLTQRYDFATPVNEDITLYAKWIGVDVTFETNGGSAIGVITVGRGCAVEKPADPTRGGYAFDGWYTDEALTEAFDFETLLTEDITLYAKWNKRASSGGSTTSKPTETTTTNPDGSVTTTVTKPDGTVTATTEKPDGTVTVVETKKDGTVTETITTPDGAKTETVTTKDGDVTITATDKDGEQLAKVELPATVPATKDRFDDVPEGHWADEAIHNAAALKLVEGVGDNQFDPNASMTRGALATVLHRLSQGKTDYEVTFQDVSEGKYYTEAVAWAAKAGVVKGFTEDIFAPEQVITREQLAAMLCRYAKVVGLDTTADAEVLDQFTDGDATGAWAVDSVAWCVKVGILQGKGNDTLDPTANVTRAEVALMLDRFLGLLK